MTAAHDPQRDEDEGVGGPFRPDRGGPLDTLRGMTELASTVLGILRSKKTVNLTISVSVQDKQ